jgi:iron complex outermembrane recepter protein
VLEAAPLWVTELKKRTDRSRKLACRTLILLWVSLEVSPGICSAGNSSAAEFEFDIPAGPAFDTLQKFIAISHIHMVYDFGLQQKTNEVHGRFSPEVALLRMLKDSGLVCSLTDGGATTIVTPSSDHRRHTRCENAARGGSHGAEAEPGPPAPSLPPEPKVLQEVKVQARRVDTRLRDIPQVGATVLEWDLTMIERSGAHNTAELIAKMTQNFGGGPTQDTLLGSQEAHANSGLGVGANLRGLGSRSTLVLLNGRRIAPSGSDASFVDQLGIPLSAIREVEVLLDGASALYGSDAVGGVINYVTKDEYIGPETFAEEGAITDGRQEQHRVSQDFGAAWTGGNLLVVVEEMHRGALSASERSQANSDLRPGGPDLGDLFSNPGNLSTSAGTYAIPARQLGNLLDFSSLTAGTFNLANRYAGADIVPDQTRHSLFASLHQNLGATSTFFTDFLWTERYATERQGGENVILDVSHSPFLANAPTGTVLEQYNLLDAAGPVTPRVNVRTFNLTLGAQTDLPSDWQLLTSASDVLETENQIAVEVDLGRLQNLVAEPSQTSAFDSLGSGPPGYGVGLAGTLTQQWYGSRSQLWDFNASADGPLFSLSGGEVHAGAGLEYRDQRFVTAVTGTGTDNDLRRQLVAAFGEVFLPLLDADTFPAPWRSLTLSALGRFEHYSDFGEAGTPRVSLEWEPVDGLSFRASLAQSVRAPNLGDLNEKQNVSFLQTLQGTSTLVWSGGNPDLGVERAYTRNLGINFRTSTSPKLTADLNYFNILYKDRVQDPAFPSDILVNPNYRNLVTYNPGTSYRQNVCDHSVFTGTPGEDCLSTPIGAIVDLRAQNAARLWTDGFDAQIHMDFDTGLGSFGWGINGTYILDYRQADTPYEAMSSLLNTLTNPINLHLLGTLSWERHDFHSALEVQYQNRYHNTLTIPESNIGSWTTLAVRLGYTLRAADSPWSRETEFALNIENVLDRYPPFAVNTIANLGYDQENGDLSGRVITASARVRW